MSDYNRTTRECPVGQLHPEIRQAVQKYFKEHELGNLETETLMCCETVSERKSSGTLSALLKDDTADTTIHMGMLFTSQLLIWVRKGDKSGVVLNAANLKEIQVRISTPLFMNDTGLEIIGYIQNSKARVRGFIATGEELAVQKFCEEVNKAISVLNPPVKKSWSNLFGG